MAFPATAQYAWESFITPASYHHYAIDAVTDEVIYAGGYGGSLVKSTDRGDTWNLVNIGSYNWVQAIHFHDVNNGWIACQSGSSSGADILKTTDGGATWTSRHNQYDYSSMVWPSTSVCYAGTWSGVIVKTTDAGNTWTTLNVPTTANLPYLYFVDELYGFAADTYNRLFRTSDGGANWDEFYQPGIHQMYFLDHNNGFCVNEYGQIGKSTDGGASFTYWDSPYPDYKLHDIRFQGTNYGYAVGGLDCYSSVCTPKPAIFKTYDGGLTWINDTSHQYVGQEIGFYAVDISPNGTPFLAGSDRVIMRNTESVGTEKLPEVFQISLYPNPTTAALHISIDQSLIGETFIIVNTLGQTVQSYTPVSEDATINVSHLESGTYYLLSHKHNISYRIVKQ